MSQLTRSSLLHSNPSTSVSIYLGSFGTLHVAIKDQIHPSLQTANNVISEAMVQLRLDHPNICKAYDCFLATSPTGAIMSVLVMELCQCNFESLMQQRKASNGYWTELELLQMLCSLSDALRYAQEKGISHRNLQPHHILLGFDGQAKLCDFSASSKNLSEAWMSTTLAGTPAYLSPEIRFQMGNLRIEYDSFKSDVWALGVTFLVLAIGDLEAQGVVEAIETIGYFQLKSVIRAMLQRDPQLRPSFAEVTRLATEAANALYQAAIPAPIPAYTKHCFMCRGAVSPDWLTNLPSDVKALDKAVKDLCSLRCARYLLLKTQSDDKFVKCTGCNENIKIDAIPGPSVISLMCGHPFHDKSCLERSLWQWLECPICKFQCGQSEIEAILGLAAMVPLQASRCSMCHLHKAITIYGICHHQLCSECQDHSWLVLRGSKCAQCNKSPSK